MDISSLDPKTIQQYTDAQKAMGRTTEQARKELQKAADSWAKQFSSINDINKALQVQAKSIAEMSSQYVRIGDQLQEQLKLHKEKNIYESRSLDDIKDLCTYKKRELEDSKKELVAKKSLLEIERDQTESYEERQKIIARIAENEAKIAKNEEDRNKYDQQLIRVQEAESKVARQYMTTQEKIAKAKEKVAEETKKQKEYQAMILGLNKEADDYEQQKKEIEEMAKKSKEQFMEDNSDDKLAQNLMGGGAKGRISDIASTFGDSLLKKLNVDFDFSSISSGISSINSLLNSLSDVLGKDIVTAVGTINSHLGKVNAALYGNTDSKSFYSIIESVNKNIGDSPYMSQQTLIENIAKFTESGISYNVEQRAFWYTLQDELVQGFDALDSSLSRIIRLQQADMTEQGIGTASKLTQLLNAQFKDTEYMESQYNSVYAAIVDAMSTMDTDQATQFNFNLQKWLSALYALGLSDSAVSSIASAMNMLATGDLSGLSGTQAQTLLALSTSNSSSSSSKTYASYLVSGMTGSDVNDIMQSMVEYLKSIAENTDSNVLKSEWGNILNLSMSDWKAISNLTDEDISTLANYNVTQQSVLDETTDLIQNVYASDRLHASQKIEYALDNASYSYGMGIAENETAYVIYRVGKVLNTLSEMTGSSALGILSGISSLATIVVGAANFIEAVSGTLGNQGGLGGFHSSDLFSWTVQRGGNITQAAAEVGEELLSESLTLESSSATSSASEDYEEIETSDADAEVTDFQASENSVSATAENIVSGESTVSRDINELYAELFENQTTPIRVKLAELEDAALIELAELTTGYSSGASNTATQTLDILRSIRGASQLV